jgi:hypothetical protein
VTAQLSYPPAPPGIVKSVRQRALLHVWQRLRGAHRVPLWSYVSPDELAPYEDDLSWFDVERHPAGDRFLIRRTGRNVERLYGKNCEGQYLDDAIPEKVRPATLEAYREVVRSTGPIFTITHLTDEHGRDIHYERLLLPFGENGQVVGRIVAFLETISLDGAHKRDGLLDNTPHCKVVTRVSIDPAMTPAGRVGAA